MVPKTQYTKSGDLHIAYQVVGDDSRDLVYLPGVFAHIELQWEEPSYARFLRQARPLSGVPGSTNVPRGRDGTPAGAGGCWRRARSIVAYQRLPVGTVDYEPPRAVGLSP